MSLLASLRPSASSQTELYTVPPGKKAVLNIYAVNVIAATPAKIRVGIQAAEGSFSDEDYEVYDLELANNEFWEKTGIALTENQSIRVYVDEATVNFHVNGIIESI